MRARENPVAFSQQIQSMFSAIAPNYDLLNRTLSCGRDKYWRRVAVDVMKPAPGERYLDIATGTADVALEIADRVPQGIRVHGVDVCVPMMLLGMHKVRAGHRENTISFQAGCCENLPFPDALFNGAVSAFGVRNFTCLTQGLEELCRVLKPGGRVVILEFSLPENFVFKFLYRFYFEKLLPTIGRFVSGHQTAYSYLPQSVLEFPSGSDFTQILETTGFRQVSYQSLTFGIVNIYIGLKA